MQLSEIILKNGENVIDGIAVAVVRRRAKNLIVRVRHDGSVSLTVPLRRASLAQGAAFLRSRWEWVLSARERVLANPASPAREFTSMEIARLQTLLEELHSRWATMLGEFGVAWKLRRMKTRWGVCNYVKRRVTYAVMLAGAPRDCVEYVVVHELTHLKAHGHGTKFKSLMDERLPDWRERRRKLKNT